MSFLRSPSTPGPLGYNDTADPDTPYWFVSNTPGPLGYNDAADPDSPRWFKGAEHEPEKNIPRGDVIELPEKLVVGDRHGVPLKPGELEPETSRAIEKLYRLYRVVGFDIGSADVNKRGIAEGLDRLINLLEDLQNPFEDVAISLRIMGLVSESRVSKYPEFALGWERASAIGKYFRESNVSVSITLATSGTFGYLAPDRKWFGMTPPRDAPSEIKARWRAATIQVSATVSRQPIDFELSEVVKEGLPPLPGESAVGTGLKIAHGIDLAYDAGELAGVWPHIFEAAGPVFAVAGPIVSLVALFHELDKASELGKAISQRAAWKRGFLRTLLARADGTDWNDFLPANIIEGYQERLGKKRAIFILDHLRPGARRAFLKPFGGNPSFERVASLIGGTE